MINKGIADINNSKDNKNRYFNKHEKQKRVKNHIVTEKISYLYKYL